MNLMKFTILNHNVAQQADEKVSMLINPDHIISVKPIKMTTTDRSVLEGYWLRLTNGKKYKAIQVPAVIQKAFESELPSVTIIDSDIYEASLQ
jgi:hypothetical protein